jgi:hypothetical protein
VRETVSTPDETGVEVERKSINEVFRGPNSFTGNGVRESILRRGIRGGTRRGTRRRI